ncbi:MAG: Asp-tRNA(Asn)/Glu-tRNA(Gln) amidotransferase subunit GatA [Candidatus Pacebacteria bacterium]|nr:Asp-tRNA(Asn)/Glu-tRNA(Gln) amidotransferase subunit GatA [Candidatus Paceibacterota bacterium]
MVIDLKTLTIKKAHEAMKAGDFTAQELAQAYLDNINPELNAFILIFDDVLEQSKKADERFKNGTAELLTGIPMAIKNNILIKGKRTTAGSKILENYKATYDATVITKLKKVGAVFIGGTNLDEFAHGSSTENSAYGVTKNTYDLERVAGGSSGGSAVAVASDMALVALGSDTGGSIRQPASFNGILGLKTTYGRVSRSGAVAMGSSFDQIGPFAKNIEDIKIVYDCIKGEDKMDSTTLKNGRTEELEQKIDLDKKMTIGIPRHFLQEGIDADVMENFEESIKKLKEKGYEVKEIELPNIKYSLAVYYILMPAEVSANLSRYDGVRFGFKKEGENLLEDYMKTKGEGFGKETRRRIILGTYILSAGYKDAYYKKAQVLRNIIRKDFEKAFSEVDVILTPTTPSPAFVIGSKGDDPVQMYLGDIFTVSSNVVGNPAISIPSGFVERDGKNLPIGLQILAPHLYEDVLVKISDDFLS